MPRRNTRRVIHSAFSGRFWVDLCKFHMFTLAIVADRNVISVILPKHARGKGEDAPMEFFIR